MINRNDIITIAIIIISAGIGTSVIVFGQTPTTDKFFTKDFCETENTLLDGITYPTGAELSYDSGGCPISTKVIHRWNELTIVDKNTVTARLVSNGYEEGEEVIASIIR